MVSRSPISISRMLIKPWAFTALSTPDFHNVALQAIGRNATKKTVADDVSHLWGHLPSPGNDCSVKRKATEDLWRSRLESLGTKRHKDSLDGSSTTASTLLSTTNVASVTLRSGIPLEPLQLSYIRRVKDTIGTISPADLFTTF